MWRWTVLFFIAVTTAQKVSYEGQSIFRVSLGSEDEADKLVDLVDEMQGKVRVLAGAMSHDRDVWLLVSPMVETVFLDTVDNPVNTIQLITDNLQSDIDIEATENEAARYRSLSPEGNYDILQYFARYDEVVTWMQSMAASSPLASLENIGKTYEGRDMWLMKVTTGGAQKQVFWLDCGIHAREWLTVPVCNYAIKTLLEGAGNDQEVDDLLSQYDFYVLPVSNPDGYEYTHTSDRMWRKTRKPTNEIDNLSGYFCNGTDPNRNFDSFWNDTGGSSDRGCQDDYRGPSAFSENNTMNMKDYITGVATSGQGVYMSIHSFTQLWLVPWGHTTEERPADAEELDRVGRLGRDALFQVHGKRFEFGTVPELLYKATGSSMDWAKGVLGMKYTYTLELRPDGFCGCNGFIVAPAEIAPATEEVWAGVKAVAFNAQWS